MRNGLCLLVVSTAVVGAYPARARGDDIAGEYHRQVAETHHHVDARLDNGAVIFDVQRTVANRANAPDEVIMSIVLPANASVYKASIRRNARWQSATLRDADEARDLFDSAVSNVARIPVGLGPMLLEQSPTGVQLSVFPVPARQSFTVRYSLKAYPCLADRVYAVELPAAGDNSLPPSVAARGGHVVRPGSPQGKRLVAACSEIDGGPGTMIVAFALPAVPVVGSWTSRPLANDRALADVRVFLAHLSSLPHKARVVFVVDASRSQSRDNIEAQLLRAFDFADELPDALYQIVVYRRFASAVLPTWTRAGDLRAAVGRLPRHVFARGNGSRFDRGVGAAMALLVGHRGPRRVIAFTDTLLPSRHAPDTMTAALQARARTDTVLHVVSVKGRDELTREWEGPFAALASQLGGIYAIVAATRDAQRLAMGELVRPRVLEAIRFVGGDGVSSEDLPELPELREGEAYTHLFEMDRPPKVLVMEGMLWSRRVRWGFTRSAAASAHLGAYVSAAGWLDEADASEIARADGLVSQWTSYLALPLKAVHAIRPEISGEIGMGTVGTVSCCGCGGGRGRRARLETSPELAITPLARACQAQFGTEEVELEVETTFDEIVDVTATQQSPLARCLVDATWDLEPARGPERAIARFKIGPGPKMETTGGRVFASREP